MKSIIENAVTTTGTDKKEEKLDEFGAPKIMVVGAGGAGCNAVNRLANMSIAGAQLVATNTDKQHLAIINDEITKILIGKSVTRGLGAGGYPEIGAKAAEVSRAALEEVLEGVDMLFISAGMGGGTGTGAAPVVASLARELGAIVISVVTLPFKLEGARIIKAEAGLVTLRQSCDTVIAIENERLLKLAGNKPLKEAFGLADDLIATMIKGITETISEPSLVNLDYADVKAIMQDGGVAAIGVGVSDTTNRVEEAVKGALSNPLLEISYKGATGALIHVEGGPDMTLDEVNRIGELVTESLDQDANVIWGARVSEAMKGKVAVMTIITGVNSPWILGKADKKTRVLEAKRVSDELGIDFA